MRRGVSLNYFGRILLGTLVMQMGSAFAASGTVSDKFGCLSAAQQFGTLHSTNSLSLDCAHFIFGSASAAQTAVSPKQTFSVAGVMNAISFQSGVSGHFDFIAGSNPDLNQIQAIALAEKSHQIWVIDKSKDGNTKLKVFVSKYGGNLSPIRTYDDPALQPYSLLQVSVARNQAVFYNSEKQTLDFMTLDLPQGQTIQKLKVATQKIINLSQASTLQPTSMVWADDIKKIFIFDQVSNSILVVDENSGYCGTQIPLSKLSSSFSSLQLNLVSGMVEAHLQDGSVVQITPAFAQNTPPSSNRSPSSVTVAAGTGP